MVTQGTFTGNGGIVVSVIRDWQKWRRNKKGKNAQKRLTLSYMYDII